MHFERDVAPCRIKSRATTGYVSAPLAHAPQAPGTPGAGAPAAAPCCACAHRIDFGGGFGIDQFDLEHQVGIGRDRITRAGRAIPQRSRAHTARHTLPRGISCNPSANPGITLSRLSGVCWFWSNTWPVAARYPI